MLRPAGSTIIPYDPVGDTAGSTVALPLDRDAPQDLDKILVVQAFAHTNTAANPATRWHGRDEPHSSQTTTDDRCCTLDLDRRVEEATEQRQRQETMRHSGLLRCFRLR